MRSEGKDHITKHLKKKLQQTEFQTILRPEVLLLSVKSVPLENGAI